MEHVINVFANYSKEFLLTLMAIYVFLNIYTYVVIKMQKYIINKIKYIRDSLDCIEDEGEKLGYILENVIPEECDPSDCENCKVHMVNVEQKELFRKLKIIKRQAYIFNTLANMYDLLARSWFGKILLYLGNKDISNIASLNKEAK